MTLEEAIARISELVEEMNLLQKDKEDYTQALKEFIKLHPSLFGSPYRRVHARLKELVKETKDAIFQETANIEAVKKSNEKIQQSIDSLLTRQTAWNKQKDQDLEKIARAIVELE